MKLTTRPLTDRTWFRPQERKRSQFTATWSDTLDLLEREIYGLQRRSHDDPVLMMDITEADLRIDGQVRASARPASPAVAIAFEPVRGPLTFRCDRYEASAWGASGQAPWQANVRAIALTLEALRAVDRYGATRSGEQYTGYRALTAAPTTDPWSTLATTLDTPVETLRRWHAAGWLRSRAMRIAHPDLGGSEDAWHVVQVALAELGES